MANKNSRERRIYKIRGLLYGGALLASDLAALLVSFLLAFWLRSHVLTAVDPYLKTLVPVPLSTQLQSGFLYIAAFSMIVFSYEGLYSRRRSLWEETRRLTVGVTLSFILLMMTVYIARAFTQFSRIVILLAWLIGLVLFPLFRIVLRRGLFALRFFRKKVLILGANSSARLVAREIRRNWTLGYEIAGFLRGRKDSPGSDRLEGVPIWGDVDHVESICRKMGVRDIVVCLPGISQERVIEIVEECEKVADNIRIVPDIGHLFSMGVEIENWGDILALSMARNLAKPSNVVLKVMFEFGLAFVLFLAFLPLIILIGLAIKLDSPGPVFYAQDRLGQKDRTYRLFKFRSMYTDGDDRLGRYLAGNEQASAEWKNFFKIRKNDPRVTRIGRFLRKTSLDELPQFFNVLRGDMSLVGPRPYMPRERENIGSSFSIISRVKPGITGLWQVRGRNMLTFQERLVLDEYYIRNWSLWLDIMILLKTLRVLLTGEGAF